MASSSCTGNDPPAVNDRQTYELAKWQLSEEIIFVMLYFVKPYKLLIPSHKQICEVTSKFEHVM